MSQRQPVLTKRDFVRRFQLGEFGNCGPVWDTFDDFANDRLSKGGQRFDGLIHMRNRKAGGDTIYNIPPERVLDIWQENNGWAGGWYLALMAPHHNNLIQGEIQRLPTGLELFYSTERGSPMRYALASSGQRAYGIIVVSLLKHYLCPNSYDWLMELLDNYDGHVVEFSCFDCNWGTIPNYNTVFWEVRSY